MSEGELSRLTEEPVGPHFLGSEHGEETSKPGAA